MSPELTELTESYKEVEIEEMPEQNVITKSIEKKIENAVKAAVNKIANEKSTYKSQEEENAAFIKLIRAIYKKK